jgi:hypothetical protein
VEEYIHLVEMRNIDDDNYYTKRDVGSDSIYIRAIEEEDVALAQSIYDTVESNFFLMARCIKRINGIKRNDWGDKDWLKFIKSLNWKDSRLFFQEIRRYTYYDKKYKHPIYF